MPALALIALATIAAPEELGVVDWRHGFDAAVKTARQAERPILLLFQEVPGWGTCKTFGRKVLSHPLVVDAANTLFLPVYVRNNSKGDDDERVRKAFREPAWNNPVVRVIDTDRKDLAPRLHRDWSVAGVSELMTKGLEKAGKSVPEWLRLLQRETSSRRSRLETAVFGMGWFWTGEAGLGLIDGVVKTTAGWIGRGEVVEVEFDPAVVTFESLVKQAIAKKAASRVIARTDAQQKIARLILGKAVPRSDDPVRVDDDKYYVSRTALKHVPMFPLQATRVNARIGARKPFDDLLSPSQRLLLEDVKAHPKAGWPVAIGKDFLEAWTGAVKTRNGIER